MTTAVYKIKVSTNSGGTATHSVNVLVRETTLFSPWTSKAAGFDGFMEIHNNTDAPVSVTLKAFNSAGVLQGGVTFTVAGNATEFRTATQVGVPVNVFAGIVLTHNGAFGAIAGNITTLNGTNGLSFDFDFRLFDAATVGNQVAAPVLKSAVSVTNGLFTGEVQSTQLRSLGWTVGVGGPRGGRRKGPRASFSQIRPPVLPARN